MNLIRYFSICVTFLFWNYTEWAKKKCKNQYTLFLWKTHIPLSGTKEVTFWPISSHYLNISDGWTTTSWATFPIQLCRRRHNHYHPLFICKYVFSIPIYVYFLYLPSLNRAFTWKRFSMYGFVHLHMAHRDCCRVNCSQKTFGYSWPEIAWFMCRI